MLFNKSTKKLILASLLIAIPAQIMSMSRSFWNTAGIALGTAITTVFIGKKCLDRKREEARDRERKASREEMLNYGANVVVRGINGGHKRREEARIASPRIPRIYQMPTDQMNEAFKAAARIAKIRITHTYQMTTDQMNAAFKEAAIVHERAKAQ